VSDRQRVQCKTFYTIEVTINQHHRSKSSLIEERNYSAKNPGFFERMTQVASTPSTVCPLIEIDHFEGVGVDA
jgi:hypothetical protein